jgi:glutamyl-tRNA synthetase
VTTGPRLRFAPSPTGYLHVGNARAALFNWLEARRTGGVMLLRVEDTDRERSSSELVENILESMRWLGLDWDGDEYYQSQFATRHADVAHELLLRGHAYRCWMTQEELADQRARAQAERRPFRIDSAWRDCSPDMPHPDSPSVIRLKAPRKGETAIDDRVQGRVTVRNAELDDFVLLRSDGTPTYMLAVVVDDHDMGVTHVIRGDDHLNNAFRQLAIVRSMGWPEPVYAHVPLIHGPDGAKMSKRHGSTGVMDYHEMGFLPEAVANYLLRLGWGHGDEETISRERAVELFDLDGVGKSPSRFDLRKLENLNGHYLREADDARLAGLAAPRVGTLIGRDLSNGEIGLLAQAMPELKPRAKTLNEIAEGATFLFRERPLDLDEKAAELLSGDSPRLLARAWSALYALDEWTSAATEAAVRSTAEAAGVKLGQLAQPLRAALTGRATSPGIFDVLVLLGREESLARIADRMDGEG